MKFAISIVLILILSALTQAEVINVPDDFETIQGAIDESEDGDTVLVAPGEYVENIDFIGKDIAVIGDPDNPEDVVIDGNENGSVVTFASGESENAILQGFLIRNGDAGESSGGGILIDGESHPIISDCVVTHNTAISAGGVLIANNSNPVFNNCWINNNTAPVNCGGVLISGSNPVLNNCTISENSSNNWGGGVFIQHGANPILEGCEIYRNSSRHFGGGIFFISADAVIRNCTIVDNEANLVHSQVNSTTRRGQLIEP